MPLSRTEIKARSVAIETRRARVEHLFGLYQALTTLFLAKPKKPRKKTCSGGQP